VPLERYGEAFAHQPDDIKVVITLGEQDRVASPG
jgi:hypothetical protein